MQQCEPPAFDLAVEFRFIDQLEEFAESLVVLLESELAQAQSITSQMGLGVGGVARKKALVVSGRDGIQLAVIGRVRREIEFERRVSGVILGWQLGNQQGKKTRREKKPMSIKHAFQGRTPALSIGWAWKQVFRCPPSLVFRHEQRL